MKPNDHPHSFHLKLGFAEANASGWGIVGILLVIPMAVLAVHLLGLDLSFLRHL